jgi:hypothetical protein
MNRDMFNHEHPYNILYIIMNLLNLKDLSLPKANKPDGKDKGNADKLPVYFPGEPFLKGPIPLNLLSKAANLPGKAFIVYTGIWHLARMADKKTIALSQKTMRDLHLNRNAVYRGLEHLESAGLVSVERHRGRNSIITILGLDQYGDPPSHRTRRQ